MRSLRSLGRPPCLRQAHHIAVGQHLSLRMRLRDRVLEDVNAIVQHRARHLHILFHFLARGFVLLRRVNGK